MPEGEDLQRLKFQQDPSQGISQITWSFLLWFGLDPAMASNMKVDFEKFDEKKNFFMWKVRIEDLLVQVDLD